MIGCARPQITAAEKLVSDNLSDEIVQQSANHLKNSMAAFDPAQGDWSNTEGKQCTEDMLGYIQQMGKGSRKVKEESSNLELTVTLVKSFANKCDQIRDAMKYALIKALK